MLVNILVWSCLLSQHAKRQLATILCSDKSLHYAAPWKYQFVVKLRLSPRVDFGQTHNLNEMVNSRCFKALKNSDNWDCNVSNHERFSSPCIAHYPITYSRCMDDKLALATKISYVLDVHWKQILNMNFFHNFYSIKFCLVEVSNRNQNGSTLKVIYWCI